MSAAATYHAGEQIKNEFDGITHDYTRKGGVVHTEILLPENAQLVREIEIALPVELTREQNISLVRKYVTEHFVAAASQIERRGIATERGNLTGKSKSPISVYANSRRVSASCKTG